MSNAVHAIVQHRVLGLNGGAKSVALYLAGFASDDGSGIWASKPTMAAQLEVSKNTVLTAIRALIGAGFLAETGTRKCTNGNTICYQLNVNLIQSQPCTCGGKGCNFCTGSKSAPVKKLNGRGSKSEPQEVQNLNPNPNGTIKEPIALIGAENQDFDFSGFCEDFMRIFPRVKSIIRTEDALQAALGEGHSASDILRGARVYADEQEGNETRFIAFAENWIADQRWESAKAKAPEGSQAPADRMAVLQRWADLIKQGKTWAVNQISPIMAREMIEADLVTKDECKALGVAF